MDTEVARWLAIAGAVSGLVGAWTLNHYSLTGEMFPGYGSHLGAAERNAKRRRKQQLGLFLIALGIFLSAAPTIFAKRSNGPPPVSAQAHDARNTGPAT